ncbi:MAG: methyltransferase [Planctomycetia bacterium]|nr:methyltransferase [Planctomycetia bacterium]
MASPPPEDLTRLIVGYWTTQSIYLAARLGIADLLREGPRPVEELAQACSADPDALYRLLRALASVGVFAEIEGKQFQLTPLAEPLRSDVPDSQWALAIMNGEEMFPAWCNAMHSMRTGKSAFTDLHGKPLFDYLADKPEKARVFDEAMTGIHGHETAAVLDAYDFSGIGVLADVGGGNGSNLAAALQRYPKMQGMLVDLPHVVARAKARVEAAGVLDRCRLVGGNFFESIAPGADAYIFRHIIHDWNEEECLTILRNCHKAMSPTSKLLVIETVIPPGNGPFMGKFLDLAMMIVPGGKERTAAEYETLYTAAGFKLTRIVPTSCEVSVVEGVKQ